MNDAHIYCTQDQIKEEIKKVVAHAQVLFREIPHGQDMGPALPA